MSEYWKSTPKYWCKFCKTFVRDTTLEKKQHDATPKHQNNIQRSLRELHKGQEREDREKQRAKDEVARLNGIVSKAGVSGSSTTASTSKPGVPSFTLKGRATADDRKKQMQQLAAMGIVPPQEQAGVSVDGGNGGWTTVSETPIYHKVVKDEMKKEEDDDEEDSKLPTSSFGVRKRKLEDDEEAAPVVTRKNWGSTLKTYPGAKDNSEDLDALLGGSAVKKETVVEAENPSEKAMLSEVKNEEPVADMETLSAIPDVNDPLPAIKQEAASSEGPAEPVVVFKKRKGIKR